MVSSLTKKRKTGNLPGDSVPSDDEHPGSTAHPPQPERPTYYRCKIADKKLREQIWKVLEPCIRPHRLMELLHSWDTQLNEAMNQIVVKYAPKHKCLGTTMALSHPVHVAIGIQHLGHFEFWDRDYSDL